MVFNSINAKREKVNVKWLTEQQLSKWQQQHWNISLLLTNKIYKALKTQTDRNTRKVFGMLYTSLKQSEMDTQIFKFFIPQM